MTPPALTAVNDYALSAPTATFTAAVQALAARVRAEGDPGVLSYRFHTDGRQARAVVHYAGPDAWMGHHRTAVTWPEFALLRASSQLTRITLLGPVTQEMRDWLSAAGIAAPVECLPVLAGGFTR